MAKWRTLSARFNEKELAVIRNYQKKHNIKDNELIRNGVSVVIGLGTMMDALQSPDMEALRSFSSEVNKQINSPTFNKAMEKATDRWAKKYKAEHLKKLDEELLGIQKELSVFERKEKKAKPKRRGRPTST